MTHTAEMTGLSQAWAVCGRWSHFLGCFTKDLSTPAWREKMVMWPCMALWPCFIADAVSLFTPSPLWGYQTGIVWQSERGLARGDNSGTNLRCQAGRWRWGTLWWRRGGCHTCPRSIGSTRSRWAWRRGTWAGPARAPRWGWASAAGGPGLYWTASLSGASTRPRVSIHLTCTWFSVSSNTSIYSTHTHTHTHTHTRMYIHTNKYKCIHNTHTPLKSRLILLTWETNATIYHSRLMTKAIAIWCRSIPN